MISIVWRWIADGGLRNLSPAELIAFVAEATLASISAQSTNELQRVGWYDNPTVDKLYKLGSSGLWQPKEQLANGFLTTDNMYEQQVNLLKCPPTVNILWDTSMTSGIAINGHHRLLIATVAIVAGGALADVVLVPPVAGMKTHAIIRGATFTSDAAAGVILFEDADATLVAGCPVAGFLCNFGARIFNTQLAGLHLPGLTVNKALRADFSNFGAGANYGWIQIEYWYEP